MLTRPTTVNFFAVRTEVRCVVYARFLGFTAAQSLTSSVLYMAIATPPAPVN